MLEELGIGYVAYSPMANGFLSGKYVGKTDFDSKLDYRSVMPQFKKEAEEKNRDLLNLLHSVAMEKNATPAQVSLAWMLCKKDYIVPIPGSRKDKRLKENAAAADIELTSDEVRAIDEALDGMEMSEVFGVPGTSRPNGK